MLKDFSLPHQQYFQLDVCRKRDIFISHSPQQKHTHVHCFFLLSSLCIWVLHIQKTSHSAIAVFLCLFRNKWESRLLSLTWGVIHFKVREGRRVQTQRMMVAEMRSSRGFRLVRNRRWCGRSFGQKQCAQSGR